MSAVPLASVIWLVIIQILNNDGNDDDALAEWLTH